MLIGCRKVVTPILPKIDLGKESTSTAIKGFNQSENVLNVTYQTTIGAKYSVQIIPFGGVETVFSQGFTANDTIVKKSYDLSGLKKMNYDLIFIDVKGKESKIPVLVK